MTEPEIRVPIAGDGDIILARRQGRDLARSAGFSIGDQTVIATAISEIARNIVTYANKGEVRFRVVTDGDRCGLVVVAADRGPGIADVELALQEGHSTAGGLGLGLPGARRLMDDFEIVTAIGEGTTITMRKWRST
ncbi:MAG TPA: anti-sigma regulatory factor [Planctomycetota bacterium]|nr:anti-sigma regulatory factor [Planctomycetota bacterium]